MATTALDYLNSVLNSVAIAQRELGKPSVSIVDAIERIGNDVDDIKTEVKAAIALLESEAK